MGGGCGTAGGSGGVLRDEGVVTSVVVVVVVVVSGGVILGGLFLLLIIPIMANNIARPKIPSPAQRATLCRFRPDPLPLETGVAEGVDEGNGVNWVRVTTVGVDDGFIVGVGVLGFAEGEGVGLLQPQVKSVRQSGFLQKP
ncbi:MAG: hypothetical protein HYV90_05260 [Candidatus Woesebacteria bacterium]|nr:MAG: hypothetical protein HYV90_05260 [Candidatus Woesebacteria bacterium]